MPTLNRTIEQTKDGFGDFVEKTRGLVNGGLDSAEATFDEAADSVLRGAKKAQKTANRLVNAAQEQYEEKRQSLSRLVDSASDYVAENPGKSLLWAAAGGFVLGMLVRGRRGDD